MLIDLFLSILALMTAIPAAMLALECAAALLPARRYPQAAITRRPRIAVLMAAHNEASGIASSIQSVLPQLCAQDRLLVVADNCGDDTAQVASSLGAQVVERSGEKRAGKSYALEYGLGFLSVDAPEVVIVLDADCRALPGSIDALARATIISGQPIQSAYLMEPPTHPAPRDLISAFALLVKNFVRPFGLQQLGAPCWLTGSGMAFPWSVANRLPKASGRLAEDMWMTVELAKEGITTMFCSQARVLGELPGNADAAKAQRTRWEHGHLETILGQGWRLFHAAFAQKNFGLLALGLDLLVPPLSLFVLVWFAILTTTIFAAVVGFSRAPVQVTIASGALLLFAIGAAWARYGRSTLPFKTLLFIPFYLGAKLPIYLMFLWKRQTTWVRTGRD